MDTKRVGGKVFPIFEFLFLKLANIDTLGHSISAIPELGFQNQLFHKPEMREAKEGKLMEEAIPLPDEIWFNILELGVQNHILSSTDLCSLSLSCKHFHHLSNDDALWSILLTLDFPQPINTPSPSSSSKKSIYKYTLERHIRRRIACIASRVVKNEHRVHLWTKRFKQLGRGVAMINSAITDVSRELFDLINECPLHWREDLIKLCHRVKEFSEESTRMNDHSAKEIAPSDEANRATEVPWVNDPISSDPASSTSSSSDDPFFRLEGKIEIMLSFQKDIFSIQQQQGNKIDSLVRRQREHGKQLTMLTTYLESLGSDPRPIHSDCDFDDDDDEDDYSDGDDDVEDMNG